MLSKKSKKKIQELAEFQVEEHHESPRNRCIFIYLKNYIIKIHPQTLLEFKNQINQIYFPFYIKNQKMISLNISKNIDDFWINEDFIFWPSIDIGSNVALFC